MEDVEKMKKLQKVKRCEKVGVLQMLLGFTLHESKSFQLSRFLLKHIPSLNQ